MCSKTWLEITSYAETFGFVTSVCLNLIHLFLISEMPTKVFGSYKYLMFSFSIIGILYSSCDFWTKPNVHITDVSFAVFSIAKDTGFSNPVGVFSLALYCSCYGMMLSLLTIHFYYRYLSVTCPPKLTRFSLKYVPLWVLLIIFNLSMWFSSVYFLNGPSEMKDEILYPEFDKVYCLDGAEEFAYVGPQYFYMDHRAGEYRYHIPSFIASGLMTCVMSLTMSCITYFGIKTYTYLYKMGMESLQIQKQLFRTLVIQTFIPMVFMYFPVCIMFLFPLVGLKIKEVGNFVPISVAIYPCFEPLVAMYCIKSFRVRIIGFVTCQKNRKHAQVSNIITTTVRD